MPHMCCVPGCKGNYRNGPKVSVYSFPKNEQLKQKWLSAINRQDLQVKSTSRVCGLHFQSTDIEREASAYDPKTGKTLTAPLTYVRLKKDAVPSLFLNVNSHKSAEKEQSQKGIIFENELLFPTLQQNITMTSSETSHSKDIPKSSLPLENENLGNLKNKRGKRKRKGDIGETSLNEMNDVTDNDHLSDSDIRSSNESSEFSDYSKFFPEVCIKVEEPWEKGYNYFENQSGDKSEDCGKMQIEIRDIRSVSNNEDEKINEKAEMISGSVCTSMSVKPLKISKREEVFGKLVASEISDLCENPELYLKTKQAILNILVEAHYEQMKFSGTIL